ncbi:uncharacterized protein LOC130136115 [Syzygium oleosum]|uniref:uncharacterized protein LOC130136115 n=1 Tax=Syzygium oleosum TaxID=219896 RepID=UPI0024B8C032|nr:uncharacterized protein LOC130136115 [Syzygium oleosum]
MPIDFLSNRSSTADRSWIHPEHRLQPTDRRDLFYCTACKEIGFGRSYSCEPCAVHVHKECVSPPPALSHPLLEYTDDLSFVRSIQTYDTETDTDTEADTDTDGGSKFCRACSKPLRGCGSMSAGGKSSFHPCCLHLDRFIKVNGEKLKLKTKNIPWKCNWYKKELIRDQRTVIPSWSYVSVGKNRRFHVGCVQDMMLESWRDGGIDQPVRGKEEDSTANFTTCLSFKIKLPIDPEEERDADPSESATQKLADYLLKVRDGNDPLTAATGDPANETIELLSDALEALKSGVESATKKEADPKMDIRPSKSEKQKAVRSGVGSGSCKVWERTKFLWRKLLLKIRQGIARLADSPVGRAGRKTWTTVMQPSKLWEFIRPLLQWLHSMLCELASRMLIGTYLLAGRLPYDAQAYSMN